jgi:predicted dehydrogenase
MIRIGVIGAGGNGAGHARYYAESSRAEFVAIADPDSERAGAIAEETNARSVSDASEFLDDVDAVIVSSPNHLHVEHVQMCTEAGKHVWCEKPMGLNRAQADAIADAVKAAGVKSMVGFAVRFTPTVQTMMRLIDEGKIGTLVSLWSRRLGRYNPARKRTGWRGDPRCSGGILFEINCHELDWMMWLGGKVHSVYALKYAQDESYDRANDHVWITLGFEEGAVATHEGSWIAPQANYYRGIQGTGATLDTEEWGNNLRYTPVGEDRVDLEPGSAFDLRGHFLDCIENGAEPVADVEWGRKVMTVADAAIDSAISGQPVIL